MRYVLARASELAPDQYVTARELAADLYGHATAGQQVAVREAINRLADRGEITAEYVVRAGRLVLAIRGSRGP